jgi:hypothetical protein
VTPRLSLALPECVISWDWLPGFPLHSILPAVGNHAQEFQERVHLPIDITQIPGDDRRRNYLPKDFASRERTRPGRSVCSDICQRLK